MSVMVYPSKVRSRDVACLIVLASSRGVLSVFLSRATVTVLLPSDWILKSQGSGDVLAESLPMSSAAMPAESALSCWSRRGLSVSITARALGGTSCHGERSFLPDRLERSQARAAT